MPDTPNVVSAEIAEGIVKPLEWIERSSFDDEHGAIGHHHLGRYAGSYRIGPVADGWGWWNSWTSDRDPEGVAATKDAAKAAAQADYASRILSALDTAALTSYGQARFEAGRDEAAKEDAPYVARLQQLLDECRHRIDRGEWPDALRDTSRAAIRNLSKKEQRT